MSRPITTRPISTIRAASTPRAAPTATSPSGRGAHQCLGLHLARLEMRTLFEVLLDRIESVELAGEPARSKSTFVGGLKTLPLRFTAA